MAKGGNGGGKPSTDESTSIIRGTRWNDILSDDGIASVLSGGRGDDIYLVSHPDTVIEEDARGDTDEVRTALSWQLGPYVENLTLTGADDIDGTGNELDNRILGNEGANHLLGLAGDDLLEGGGGDDTLEGGAGNDVLDGGTGADVLVGGSGTDTARFDGASGDYEITRSAGEIWVTRDGERDVLAGIETLLFADGPIDAATIDAGPVAVGDTAEGIEDGELTIHVLSNDQGSGLAVVAAEGSAKGTLTVNADGSITYRPDRDANGVDEFTYTIRDAAGQTDTATVTLDLAPVADAPVAVDDGFALASGETLAGNVLGNDRDPDGDPLEVARFDALSEAGGQVAMALDGSFSYSPAAGFSGIDRFTYRIADGQGGVDEATVTISVDAAADPALPPHYVEGLLYPYDWARLNWPEATGTSVEVTYAFLDEMPAYKESWGVDHSTVDSFSAEQKAMVRAQLDLIESYTGLSFVEVATPEEAVIAMGKVDLGGGSGSAASPYGGEAGSGWADLWIDAGYDTFVEGEWAWSTMVHELGHTLGLDHPTLPEGEDTEQFSVMSSARHPGLDGYADGFRLYDIAALQHLYGANTTHAAGDDVYGADELQDRAAVIWDAGGHDRFDLSDAAQAVRIDLGEGRFSTVHASGTDNLAIAFGTLIEDATGSVFDDVLSGNGAANSLAGGGGNDTLTGGAGGDVFVFRSGGGSDTVTDFERGSDRLDLGTDLAALETQSGPDGLLIDYGGGTVLLKGIAAIDEGDLV